MDVTWTDSRRSSWFLGVGLVYTFLLVLPVHHTMVKIVGIAIVRADSGVPEPIPVTVACDLTSYGFFQRQVSLIAGSKRLAPSFPCATEQACAALSVGSTSFSYCECSTV